MTKMIFVSFTVTHLQASIAFADPDEHVWGAFWMDPAAIPPSDRKS